MRKYMPRLIEKSLDKRLKAKGAVLIEGAKWCGKTTTAKHIAKSVLFMDNPERTEQYQNMAKISPSLLLEGDVPRLIDEWQIAPNLWNAVRYEVDQRDEFGQFVLTGSAVPAEIGDAMHTGTGRISRICMRPMSLFESGESSGKVSLEQLFNGAEIAAIDESDIAKCAFLICRGGWPKSIGLSDEIALFQAVDYFDSIISNDISRVDKVKRDKVKARRLLKSFARHVGTQASLETIRKDVLVNHEDTFDNATMYSYLDSLRKIFVIEDSPAWNPNLRSKTSIRTSDTRYFVDPSVATAALGVGPQDLLDDLNTMGFLFENLCVRDLRVYADFLDGEIYHFREKNGLECDAVLHRRNGSYGLIEIKLGGDDQIEEGANNLIKLASMIDTKKMKKPSFMLVLCATNPYAYQREDGVYVVPITCLRP